MIHKIKRLRQNFFILNFLARFSLLKIWIFIKFRIFRIQRDSFSVTTNIKIGSKLAVIAIYPKNDPGYLKSLSNIVQDLYKLNYTVLIVSNKEIDSRISEIFSQKNQTIIGVRPNFGRDFGAYQSAVLWLQRTGNYEKLESLFIFNDTLLWEKNNRKILEWMSLRDWGCLYLNLERHTHAQSFALHFSSNVIKSKNFQKFWRNYIPMDSRRHAIHSGEIALSSKLLRNGFNPQSYVNPSIFSNQIRMTSYDLEFLADLPISGIFPSQQAGAPVGFNPNNNYNKSENLQGSKIKKTNLYNWLSQYVYSDAPHRIGLHVSVLFGVPIKRDIYKFYRFSDIKQALERFSSTDSESFFNEINSSANQFMIGDKKGRNMRLNGEV